MNETCLNAKWLREDLTKENAQLFAKDVLNHMRNRLVIIRNSTVIYIIWKQHLQNPQHIVWQNMIKSSFPILSLPQRPENTPYYTNSSHLPVGFTDDIFEALDIQDAPADPLHFRNCFPCFLRRKTPGLASCSCFSS